MKRLFLLAVLLIVAAAVAAAFVVLRSPDPTYKAWEILQAGRCNRYDPLILSMAGKHRVDPTLVKAMVWRESRFAPDKVGGDGERGLMQISEIAAADWVKAQKVETFAPNDLFDPKTNIDVGTWYLARGLDRWKEKDDPIPFALAEYNAGRSRVNRWIGEIEANNQVATGEALREGIDFPTTANYLKSVIDRMKYYQQVGSFDGPQK